ncbi:hypothetical protein [Tateyamaria sp.]|uniref:hypothetical protein n=1 Tax=Tateyamaria sp. TaxID=1929288 RepID=UPI003B225C71
MTSLPSFASPSSYSAPEGTADTPFHYYISVQEDADSPEGVTTFNDFAAELAASSDPLLIIETGITSDSIPDTLTSDQLAGLIDNGHDVIGYVNVAVVDHNRSYWDPNDEGWVSPDPNDPDDLDFGTINDSAPDWLKKHVGVATGPEEGGDGNFGYIVDYSDEAWRNIVIADAVMIVKAGYTGVFLDDVSRYYLDADGDGAFDGTLEELSVAAQEMMSLINDIADAVHAVDADAKIFLNGGAYLGANGNDGGTNLEWWKLLDNVDGLLMENVGATPFAPNWDEITDAWFDSIDFQYIIDEAFVDQEEIDALAEDEGIDIEIVEDANYDDAPPLGDVPPVQPDGSGITQTTEFTNGFGRAVFFGTVADDEIHATANPTLGAVTGAIVYGDEGSDLIYGTAGDNLIFGGDGDDVIYAGGGNDTVDGGLGDDTYFFFFDGTTLVLGGPNTGPATEAPETGPDLGAAIADTFLFEV